MSFKFAHEQEPEFPIRPGRSLDGFAGPEFLRFFKVESMFLKIDRAFVGVVFKKHI